MSPSPGTKSRYSIAAAVLCLVVACARPAQQTVHHVALSDVTGPSDGALTVQRKCRLRAIVTHPNPNGGPAAGVLVNVFLVKDINNVFDPSNASVGGGVTDTAGNVDIVVDGNLAPSFYEARLDTGERSNDVVCTTIEPIH